MIDISKILILQHQNIVQWHQEINLTQMDLPWRFIEENNQWNFKLWHEEDIARIKDIEPSRMVLAKQNIDKFNQARNNAMEQIDEWVLQQISSKKVIQLSPKLHSETPGMMIDRLSIMQLKKYHMEEEVVRETATLEHREKCQQKVNVLEEQIHDLSNCLKEVFEHLERGDLKFKVYRQFKMYNDPSLNPQLYKSTLNNS